MRTTTMATARVAAVLAAAGLVVAAPGCGGDGSKTLTKSEYLSRASTVCQKGRETLTSASDAAVAKLPPGQKLSDAQLDDFVRTTVIPTIRGQIRELRTIPPPKGGKNQVQEIYTALDKGLDELEKDPKKLTDGSNVFGEADALAKKYGISVCATG